MIGQLIQYFLYKRSTPLNFSERLCTGSRMDACLLTSKHPPSLTSHRSALVGKGTYRSEALRLFALCARDGAVVTYVLNTPMDPC